MHSTVYELSDYPIPESCHATPGCLPDWFFGSVCDYATKMSDTEREHSILSLADHFGELCTRSGDKLTFSPLLKQTYFKENHKYFKAAAKALAETDYEIFAGIRPAVAFDLAWGSILESYEDKHSFYVYSAGKGELTPLDSWLRSADISKPFYIGGTINYYY